MSRRSHAKKRTARVFNVEKNVAGDHVYRCALWTGAGFAYASVIVSTEQIEKAGGLRRLVAAVLQADKVIVSRGVR